MTTHAQGSPQSPRPYPFIPPEVVPPGPGPGPGPGPHRPPAEHPPVPTVHLPDDGFRSGVYDQLLTRRTVLIDRPLDTATASLVAAQLMTLDADSGNDAADNPVTLMVNCTGGPIDAASAVLDTVDLLRCPVDTTCLGRADGTAAVIVAAGTGRRRAGPSAQLRLQLPEVELSGNAERLQGEVDHLRRLHDALVDRLAAATGQERRLVARDIESGRSVTAPEAVTYGLIDELTT